MDTIMIGRNDSAPTRENAKKRLASYFANPKGYDARHIVVVLWRGPITGSLSTRSGAFDDHTEAEIFAKGLAQQYRDYKFPFAVYMDGTIFDSERAEEIVIDDEEAKGKNV